MSNPRHRVTLHSGDIGDTLPPRRGGHALEGVSRRGRTSPVCRPPAGRREDGRPLCEEFGISRKTGYKIFERYQRHRRAGAHATGAAGPIGTPISCPMAVEKLIVGLKREYPELGRAEDSRAAAAALARASRVPPSAPSTPCSIAMAWSRRRRRAARALTGTPLSRPAQPNRLWCADYKGEFMLRQSPLLLPADDHRLRQSLSDRVRGALDHARSATRSPSSSASSRILGCPRRSAPTTACPLPPPMRSMGLSKLAVWWLRLGIAHRAHCTRAIPSRTAGMSACT